MTYSCFDDIILELMNQMITAHKNRIKNVSLIAMHILHALKLDWTVVEIEILSLFFAGLN